MLLSRSRARADSRERRGNRRIVTVVVFTGKKKKRNKMPAVRAEASPSPLFFFFFFIRTDYCIAGLRLDGPRGILSICVIEQLRSSFRASSLKRERDGSKYGRAPFQLSRVNASILNEPAYFAVRSLFSFRSSTIGTRFVAINDSSHI